MILTWISTYSGVDFDLFKPTEDKVFLEDIAHSLALQCRFNGHCSSFISIAEHSINTANLLDDRLAFAGLLHDAAEAYLTDVPRPYKDTIIIKDPYTDDLLTFRQLEKRILDVIFSKFGIDIDVEDHIMVKHADDLMLATEASQLMSNSFYRWGYPLDPVEDYDLMLYNQDDAKEKFLEYFYKVSGK